MLTVFPQHQSFQLDVHPRLQLWNVRNMGLNKRLRQPNIKTNKQIVPRSIPFQQLAATPTRFQRTGLQKHNTKQTRLPKPFSYFLGQTNRIAFPSPFIPAWDLELHNAQADESQQRFFSSDRQQKVGFVSRDHTNEPSLRVAEASTQL